MKNTGNRITFARTATLIFLMMIFFIPANAIPDAAPEPGISVSVADNGNSDLLTIKISYEFPRDFHQTHNPDFFRVDIVSPELSGKYKVVYPEGKKENDTLNYYGMAVLTLVAEKKHFTPGKQIITVSAGYQLCDEEGTCYMPGKKEFSVEADLQVLPETFSWHAEAADIMKYILFAFLGGLLLNVMPCVFPLLSIKALSLVKQSEDDRRKILLSSLSYASGIIISLFILAIFLIILKSAGKYAGWGFQMQSPWFVMALSTVIFIFSLSMFDVFTVTLPGGKAAARAGSAKGYAGQFLTGIFAVLVAAPCTAPFLGPAIAYALSRSSLIIITFFIFAGTGFAFPFIMLGLNPALVRMLPKPGRWSSVFKEILGFILALTAVYLLSGLLKKRDAETAINVFYFLLITSFAAWFYGKIAAPGASMLRIALALAFSTLLVATGWVFLLDLEKPGIKSEARVNAEEIIPEKEYVRTFSLQMLESLEDENRPVFVNIYADWCTTCKVNERFVLSSPEIDSFFREKSITVLRGDFTEGNPEIAKWMKESGKAGVPVYAYYLPSRETTGPVFLPEILSKEIVIKYFSQNR